MIFWFALPIILILVRLINLLGLSLYLDEGIYIFWAKLFSVDQSFAYAPLTDGKTPLFMWLVAGIYPIFHDFLYSGRFISVISGGIALLSWMIILYSEVNKKTVFWFWLLFLLVPYAFLIERMAFADSLLTAFVSLTTMCLVLSFKNTHSLKKWWLVAIGGFFSGVSLGLAYFTKTSARAFLVVLLIVSLIWIIKSIIQKKYLSAFGAFLSAGIMYLIYHELISDLRIGAQRFWGMIDIKEAELTYTLPQIFDTFFIKHNLLFIYQGSIPYLSSYFAVYLGVLILPAIIGIIWIFKFKRNLLWIFIYFFIATLGIFLSARMMSSRYFYPVVPSFIALAAFGAIQLWEKIKYGKFFLGIILLILFIQSSFFLINPLQAFYSYDDRDFFVAGYTTALGLMEIKKELEASSSDTVIGVSGIWGIPEGATVVLSDIGIETVGLSNWLGGNNVNLANLVNNPKPNKYLYLTLDETNALIVLGNKYNYTIINEFIRPISGSRVYLIKLGQAK